MRSAGAYFESSVFWFLSADFTVIRSIRRHDHVQQPMPEARGCVILLHSKVVNHGLQRGKLTSLASPAFGQRSSELLWTFPGVHVLDSRTKDFSQGGRLLLDNHNRLPARNKPRRGVRLVVVVGSHLRHHGKPLFVPVYHIHEKNVDRRRRQHLAAAILQQRQCQLTVPAVDCTLRRTSGHLQLRPIVEHDVLVTDAPQRCFRTYDRHRNRIANQGKYLSK